MVSKEVFQALDHKRYNRLVRWARFRHPRKSRHWIADRYWEVNRTKAGYLPNTTDWRSTNTPACRLYDTPRSETALARMTATGVTGRRAGGLTRAYRTEWRNYLKINADDAQPVDSSSRWMHLLRSIISMVITTITGTSILRRSTVTVTTRYTVGKINSLKG